jgi:hypothetical protein
MIGKAIIYDRIYFYDTAIGTCWFHGPAVPVKDDVRHWQDCAVTLSDMTFLPMADGSQFPEGSLRAAVDAWNRHVTAWVEACKRGGDSMPAIPAGSETDFLMDALKVIKAREFIRSGRTAILADYEARAQAGQNIRRFLDKIPGARVALDSDEARAMLKRAAVEKRMA